MTRRGLVLFGLMSVIWGVPYLFIRVAVDEISPATLVFVRTTIGAAILLPIALVRVDMRAILVRWRWVVAFAAIEIAIPWVMLGSAEQHISSSLAGLLVAGVPLVGTALALATGGADRLGRTGMLGLLVGLVGVAAIVGADFRASDATAFLQILVVVVGYAVGPAILARRLGGLPSIGVMALSLTLCALLYAPITAAQWPSAVPSANAIFAIAVLGVLCTAVAFLLFAGLIAEVGPVRATVITYVNPAVAAVLGVLVLHETFTVAMAIGFALVIMGSGLATRPSLAVQEAALGPETHIDAGVLPWRIAWRAAYVVARRWGRLMRFLAARGVPTFEHQFVELALVGRKSRRPRTVIVTLIRLDDRWYVGHPNGPRSWLANLAASETVAAAVLGQPPVHVRPVALGLGPERDAVIRATARQQPIGARGWSRAAQSHILRAGVYYRLDPIVARS